VNSNLYMSSKRTHYNQAEIIRNNETAISAIELTVIWSEERQSCMKIAVRLTSSSSISKVHVIRVKGGPANSPGKG
jgi:hypothetical protein